jgi:hypothetical protein
VTDALFGLEGALSSLAVTGEITANGGIALGDNDKATFGASDDLEIYHDGSNSIIADVGTGHLKLLVTTCELIMPTAVSLIFRLLTVVLRLFITTAPLN